MSSGWRLAGGVLRVIARSSIRAGDRLGSATQEMVRRRSTRGGILGPGDPSPAPGDAHDFYDYRGVASRKGLSRPSSAGTFGLGRHLDPRHGLGARLGISAADLSHHALIVGPTGVGKTTGLIVPWIGAAVETGNCAVIVDVKGAGAREPLLMQVRDELERRGLDESYVSTWDYTADESISWDVLASLKDTRSVELATRAVLGSDAGYKADRHFYERDYRWLRALLHLCVRSSDIWSLPQLAKLIANRSDLQAAVRLHSRSLTGLEDLAELDSYDYSRALAGLTNRLNGLASPEVARILEGRAPRVASPRLKGKLAPERDDAVLPAGLETRTMESLLSSPGVVIVGAPVSDGELSSTLAALFLSQATNTLLQGRLRAPGMTHFFFLDEAPRLKDRIDLEMLLSLGRSAGLSLVLAAQDVSQFGDPGERSSLITNCRTMVVFPLSSKATTDDLQARLGTRVQNATSVSEGPSASMGRGRTYSHTLADVPVIGHREICSPPFGGRVATVHSDFISRQPLLVDLTVE